MMSKIFLVVFGQLLAADLAGAGRFGQILRIVIFMKKNITSYVFGVADSKSGVKKKFWLPIWPAPAIFGQILKIVIFMNKKLYFMFLGSLILNLVSKKYFGRQFGRRRPFLAKF